MDEDKRPGGILSVLRPDRITVPEGTAFPVVLETGISSATSRSGDRVVARLAEDVRVGEKVVVPSGSEVRGQVTGRRAVGSRQDPGPARLRLRHARPRRQGALHRHEDGSTSPPANTHNRDAATIGIGAGAGAIVGAVVDGKKGAGIGALIGGAAGTGVVLTDTGKEITLGTGSRVNVRLTREARL